MRRDNLVTRLLTGLLCALLIAGPAAADSLDWLGSDSRAIATGGGAGGVAMSKSASALYSNPANLVRATPSMGWDYVMYHPVLRIRLMDRPDGVDVGQAGATGLATSDLPNPRRDTTLSYAHHNILMCIISDFGVKKFRMGTILKTPLPTLASMRFRYEDEREQLYSNRLHMARFGEWDDMIFFQTGAGYQPLDWLSFGASLKTNFLIRSQTSTVNVGDGTAVTGGVDFEIKFRPVFGLAFQPLPWLRLGVTYRMESRVEGIFTTKVLGEDGEGGLVQDRRTDRMTTLFEPHELALGVGAEGENWFVDGSVTAAWWSRYPTQHRESLGGRARFKDTVNAALGAGWAWRPWGETLLGVAFHPSVAPTQTGRTNFVDCHSLGLTAGQRFRFKLFGIQMEAGVHAQAWHLFEEVVHKDPALILDEDPSVAGLQTNNPGYPGYRAGGWTFLAGASLRLEL